MMDKKFATRHLCLTELGANDDFLGTGLTKDTRPEATQESGVAEILRLEHNPPAIAELEKQGLLRVVPCAIT
jgi:hypothetical protein